MFLKDTKIEARAKLECVRHCSSIQCILCNHALYAPCIIAILKSNSQWLCYTIKTDSKALLFLLRMLVNTCEKEIFRHTVVRKPPWYIVLPIQYQHTSLMLHTKDQLISHVMIKATVNEEQNVLLTCIYIQLNYVIEQAAVNEQQNGQYFNFCLY